ncbi:YkyA family protein [Bacillus coahuilensis]|uniref:YkyA family protein n=1 Tax=Bacillus coahuilensis TaxID=408580 RepID=UPI000750379B|nr:YkyA family protein [Bacillus coahuilensis]
MKKRMISSVLVGIFLLTGCLGGPSPEENMFTIMEETVTKEQPFQEVQEPLKKLEEEGNDIFSQIVELSNEEFDQIVTLSDQALENIGQRREKMEEEVAAMEESKEHFSLVAEEIEKIENESLKKQADELVEVMNKRYDLHDKLAQAYYKALDADQLLYESMKKEDVEMEELETLVNDSNTAYDEIFVQNKEFNEVTAEFNEKN